VIERQAEGCRDIGGSPVIEKDIPCGEAGRGSELPFGVARRRGRHEKWLPGGKAIAPGRDGEMRLRSCSRGEKGYGYEYGQYFAHAPDCLIKLVFLGVCRRFFLIVKPSFEIVAAPEEILSAPGVAGVPGDLFFRVNVGRE